MLSVSMFGFAVQGLPLGELPAVNNRIELDNKRYEIDGVCKFSENAALCWKPNGEPNPELSDRLTNAIQHPKDNNPVVYTVAFLKKKRFLILKSIQNGQNAPYSYPRVSTNQSSQSGFKEGWTESSQTRFMASQRDFDGSETTWSTIEGTFEPATKEFPLRYEFTQQSPKPVMVKLEPSKFEVDGNTFEIVSITDHPKSKMSSQIQYVNGFQTQVEPKIDITFRVVSVGNPFSSMYVRPADNAGNVIAFADEKGNPVSEKLVEKWNIENSKQVPGKPRAVSPYGYVGGFGFDGKDWLPSQRDRVYPVGLNRAKFEALLVTSSKRTVYVFEHIKLDPN